MWSRFVGLSLCYLAIANGVSQRGESTGFGQYSDREDRQHSTGLKPNDQDHFSGRPAGISTHDSFHKGNENQQSGFRPSNTGNSFVEPTGGTSFGHGESEYRPTGSTPSYSGGNFFGQPGGGSREGNNHPSGSMTSNSGNSFGRPVGGSTLPTNSRERENRPFGSSPSSSGDNSFSRPTGGSTLGHRENENRPFGSSPSSSGDNSFSRPTGGSTLGHRENENRPFGSSPSSSGDNSFSRPTGGSTLGHRENENRPFGSSPSSSGDNSFSRPTGGSTSGHRENENRPFGSSPSSSGDNSFSRPTGGSTSGHRENENRPFGSSPSSSGDNSFSRPTGGSTSGHRENEKRPLGINSSTGEQHFGRPTGSTDFGQNSGFRPDQEHLGGETHGPSEQTGMNEAVKEKEEDKDVCFSGLGCFKMGKPWKTTLRPIGPPHGPEKIQTTIHFYSRENLEMQKNITLYPQINMGQVRFNPSKITAMIVHGFSNSGNATWMKDMKNVYLKKVDANVMIVDWGKGAQLLNYLQVASNTRIVGKQLGLFVKYLIDNFRADPGKFHLIGHSLGAQICSYLGKEVPGIARLTALDPAQPGFEGFDEEVRLNKNDAEFVDVIHTDAKPFIPALGFGMITPHGHVDFYMNGGFDQPGCVPPPKKEIPSIKNFLDFAKFPVEVIAKTVACPHARAYEYLIESFNETENCIFWGHKADVKNIFKSVTNTVTQGLLKKFTALSSTCSKEDCIPVGFATKKSPLRGVFVVTTRSRSPYCVSEPGVPPEVPPGTQSRDDSESFAEKVGKKFKFG